MASTTPARSPTRSIRETPATLARIAAGYSIDEVAKKLHIKPRTYRMYELHGRAPDKICDRASRLLGCSQDLFFFSPEFIWKREQAKAIGLRVSQREAAGSSVGALNRTPSAKPLLLMIPGGKKNAEDTEQAPVKLRTI